MPFLIGLEFRLLANSFVQVAFRSLCNLVQMNILS